MFKKALSILIALVLFAAVIPSGILAEARPDAAVRDSLIHEVHVQNFSVPPIAGTETEYTSDVVIEANEEYTFADDSYGLWWDNTSGSPVPFWGEFVAGRLYSQGTILEAREGYAFAPDVTVYIDGRTLYVDHDNTYVEGSKLYIRTIPTECTAGIRMINEIRVEGAIFPPVAGVNADSTLAGVHLDNDELYFFSEGDLSWYDLEADDFFYGEFVLGRTYALFVPVIASYGYEFADTVTLYINGSMDLVSEDVYFDPQFVNFLSISFTAVESAPEPEFIYGDASGDGEVTIADTIIVCRHAMGLLTLEGNALLAADVNGSGDATMEDALLILHRVLGLIEAFPVE